MADPEFVQNPWSAEFWNLTRQGMFVRKYGVAMAEKKAAAVGTTMNGKPKIRAGDYVPLPRNPNFTVIVQRKGLPAPVGGGGLVGAGSSGDGPPPE